MKALIATILFVGVFWIGLSSPEKSEALATAISFGAVLYIVLLCGQSFYVRLWKRRYTFEILELKWVDERNLGKGLTCGVCFRKTQEYIWANQAPKSILRAAENEVEKRALPIAESSNYKILNVTPDWASQETYNGPIQMRVNVIEQPDTSD